jgi:hypothetical protein
VLPSLPRSRPALAEAPVRSTVVTLAPNPEHETGNKKTDETARDSFSRPVYLQTPAVIRGTIPTRLQLCSSGCVGFIASLPACLVDTASVLRQVTRPPSPSPSLENCSPSPDSAAVRSARRLSIYVHPMSRFSLLRMSVRLFTRLNVGSEIYHCEAADPGGSVPSSPSPSILYIHTCMRMYVYMYVYRMLFPSPSFSALDSNAISSPWFTYRRRTLLH